jgi:signal transduction histidine kinase
MRDLLFNYGIRLFDALAILLVLLAAGALGLWLLWRWNRRLRRELAAVRAQVDPARLQSERQGLESAVAHEFVTGLHALVNRCAETRAGLRPEQIDLRDQQDAAIALGYDLEQRARNLTGLYGLDRVGLQKQLVNPRALVEGVLKDLFPYAEAQGVVLRPNLASLEPLPLNPHLAAQALGNLVHNAIKYAPRGSVIDIDLRLLADGRKRVAVDVRDRGRGIAPRDQTRLFALRVRADGLVEPGSGLGLYYARELARRHGGEVELVESAPNEGSRFRLTLPYEERGA